MAWGMDVIYHGVIVVVVLVFFSLGIIDRQLHLIYNNHIYLVYMYTCMCVCVRVCVYVIYKTLLLL